MIVTNTMKVALGVGVLVLVGAFALIYIPQANKFQVATTPEATPIIELGMISGIVVSTDETKMEITIATSSAQLIIKIDPKTVITETLTLTDPKGAIKSTNSGEVNIGDVKVGTTVNANFFSVKDNVLTGVTAVDFSMTTSLADYNKKQLDLGLNTTTVYVGGIVVNLDSAKNVLEYKALLLGGGVSTTTRSVIFTDKTPVYSAGAFEKVKILHARTRAALSDIKVDNTIFLMLDTKSLREQKPLAQTIVIINTGI